MTIFEAVAEAFRLLPGEWSVTADGAGAVTRAVRGTDGLEVRLQVIDGAFLRVDPVLPRTPQRSPDPDDWYDVHHGAMPKPARIALARGAALVAERLSRGILVEAEALHRTVREVVRIEQQPDDEAALLLDLAQASDFIRKVTDHPDGTREFRLSGPFAGTMTVRRNGSVRLLMQEMPPGVAASLIASLPAHAAQHVRAPLPRYEPPTGVVRRGPLSGSSGAASAAGGTRARVLAALTADPPASQASVATALGITRQAVSAHVQALRAQGLLPPPEAGRD